MDVLEIYIYIYHHLIQIQAKIPYIHGTFSGLANLLQSPNFMSTKTDYSQTIPFMSVFINPIRQTKYPQIFQFTKLNVCQMYHIYYRYFVLNCVNSIAKMLAFEKVLIFYW